jgi:hypothetical protein
MGKDRNFATDSELNRMVGWFIRNGHLKAIKQAADVVVFSEFHLDQMGRLYAVAFRLICFTPGACAPFLWWTGPVSPEPAPVLGYSLNMSCAVCKAVIAITRASSAALNWTFIRLILSCDGQFAFRTVLSPSISLRNISPT